MSMLDEYTQLQAQPTTLPSLPFAPSPYRTLYRTLSVPGHADLEQVDFLTVNGVRFIRASENITIIGWEFATLGAAIVIAATIVGALIGAWLFHC